MIQTLYLFIETVFELCVNISEYAIQVRVYCESRTVTNAEEVLQVHPDKEL
jgi:hypothetical protein